MDRKKYVVVSSSGNTPFSKVVNDCDTGFCFPVSQGDNLSTVFKKLCNYVSNIGITETDPLFRGSASYSITNTLISNWNEAFSWGNHNLAGYLTSETDPIWTSVSANYRTEVENDLLYYPLSSNPSNYLMDAPSDGSTYGRNNGLWTIISGGGPESDPVFNAWLVSSPNISLFTNDVGYLTSYSETDPIYSVSSWFSTTNNSTDWDTAFAWGNHATVGYLTAETDPSFTAWLAGPPNISEFTNNLGYITNNFYNSDGAFGVGNRIVDGTGSTLEFQSLNDFSLQSLNDIIFNAIGEIDLNLGDNLRINTDPGLSGDVITSQGPGLPPIWTTPSGGVESDPVWLADKPSYLTSAIAAATYSVIGHTHTFASLTSKPTTLAGYGITDAYPLTGNPSGFLTSFTESDPVWLADKPNYLTSALAVSTYVPLTRTINSVALSSNIVLTTANIADSTNKRYVTDAQLVVIGNTSGTNTGDQNLAPYLTSATAASTYQPLDSDLTAIAALATDSFGRGLLPLTTAAAVRAYIGAGTGSDIDSGELTLANTGFSWVGTNPPSGTENHTYRYIQDGKKVNLHVNVNFQNPGTSLTALTIPLPVGCPAPYIPNGSSGASVNLYTGSGRLIVSLTTVPLGTNNGFCILRANSLATGYELFIGGTSGSQRIAIADIEYITG